MAGGKPVGYLQAWPMRDLNPGPPDFKFGALIAGPRRLPGQANLFNGRPLLSRTGCNIKNIALPLVQCNFDPFNSFRITPVNSPAYQKKAASVFFGYYFFCVC